MVYITMERTCEVQLLAEAAGTPVSSTKSGPAHPRPGRLPLAGWFSFQPLYDKIVADQPDLLE